MVSLYKRANARQNRVLKIVEGAVKNAADHHPEFNYTPRLARSIAKRAAGTLTAQWRDVLAISMISSDGLGQTPAHLDSRPESHWSQNPGARGGDILGSPSRHQGGAQGIKPHPVLRRIIKELSLKVGEYKRRGLLSQNLDHIKAEGLIEALRIIDRLMKNQK